MNNAPPFSFPSPYIPLPHKCTHEATGPEEREREREREREKDILLFLRLAFVAVISLIWIWGVSCAPLYASAEGKRGIWREGEGEGERDGV